MITVLSINKSSEGLILKSSSLRYSWAFKIKNNSHLVEYTESSMGLKSLFIDSKEISSVRSFIGKFNEKFILDNILFHLKPDEEDYDIFIFEQNLKFKELYKTYKSQIEKKNNEIHFFEGFGNPNNPSNGKNNQKNRDFGNNTLNIQNFQNFGKNNEKGKFDAFSGEGNKNNRFNFDDFNFGKNPVKQNISAQQQFGNKEINLLDDFDFGKNQKKTQSDNFEFGNNNFDDNDDFENFDKNPFEEPKKKINSDPWTRSNFEENFNFENEKKQNKLTIFGNPKSSPETSEPTIFDDPLTKNLEKAVLIQDDNKSYKVAFDDDEDDKMDRAFYTEEDFDRELEDSKKNKKSKINLDMDPEEGLKMVKKGIKNIFKKTSKIVDKLESKCVNLVYGKKLEVDLEENKKESIDMSLNIDSFYGGIVS